jgi:hypothetical protein
VISSSFLFVTNILTSPGEWWVQWAALGLYLSRRR